MLASRYDRTFCSTNYHTMADNVGFEFYWVLLQELEESKCYFVSQRFAVRRKMAKDLLYGELRVLRSAAEWLNHYCTTLFSVTSKPILQSLQ